MLLMRKAIMTDLFENGEAQATTPMQEPLKLRTVLAEIAVHACEPGFSAMAIAEKYGVTEREVRRLLKKTGKSFSDHKLRRRLERARAARRSYRRASRRAGYRPARRLQRSREFRRQLSPAVRRGAGGGEGENGA